MDGPVGTNREYNIRNGYTVPFRYNRKNTSAVLAKPGWLFGVIMKYWMNGGMPTRANYPEGMTEKFTHVSTAERKTKNDSLAWNDLKVLRDMWPGKLIVKGILTPQDAELAIANGADGILVSNHGGRNFDSSMAPIEVLPCDRRCRGPQDDGDRRQRIPPRQRRREGAGDRREAGDGRPRDALGHDGRRRGRARRARSISTARKSAARWRISAAPASRS